MAGSPSRWQLGATFALAAACLLSGCATIPPAALAHAEALREYQEKSGAATLGVYDATVGALKYSLEGCQTLDRTLSNDYIAACNDASDTFTRTNQTLGEISTLTGALPGTDPAKQADLVLKLQEKIARLQAELGKEKTGWDAVANEMRQRLATHDSLYAAHLRKLDLDTRRLRDRMSSSFALVVDEMARQEALFTAYLNAQSKMKQVFGPQLAMKAEAVSKQAGDLVDKYQPYLDSIQSVFNQR